MRVHRTENLQRFHRGEAVEPVRLDEGPVLLVCLVPGQSWDRPPGQRLTLVVSEGQGYLESGGSLVTVAAGDVVTAGTGEAVRIAADAGGLVAVAVGG